MAHLCGPSCYDSSGRKVCNSSPGMPEPPAPIPTEIVTAEQISLMDRICVGNEGLKRYHEELKDLLQKVNLYRTNLEMYEIQAVEKTGQIEELINALQNLKITLFNALEPSIQALTKQSTIAD